MHESSLFISNPILVAGKVDGSTVNSSKDMPANTCLDRWPIARTGDRRGEPCLVFGNLSTACKLDWSSYESPMKANLLFIEASPSAEQQAWTSLPTLVLVFLFPRLIVILIGPGHVFGGLLFAFSPSIFSLAQPSLPLLSPIFLLAALSFSCPLLGRWWTVNGCWLWTMAARFFLFPIPPGLSPI